MHCEAVLCKNRNLTTKKCSCYKQASIGIDGQCSMFEKGFMYYLHLLPAELAKRNFLVTFDISWECRCSIYYLMNILPIEFSQDETRGIIMFRRSDTKEYLDGHKISDMLQSIDFENEKINKLYRNFMKYGISKYPEKDINLPLKEYGWLSPTGIFYPADFGDHESVAYDIIEKKGYSKEFLEWKKLRTEYGLARDFLNIVKKYILIDDPMGLGNYFVTGVDRITKKQKSFLFDYFQDMGMHNRAEQYL